MAKYFLDTEFHERSLNLLGNNFENNTIELISIGIVREDGKELYAVSKDFDIEQVFENDWLLTNVLSGILNDMKKDYLKKPYNAQFKSKEENLELAKFLINSFALSNEEIKHQILDFIGEDIKPEFYAYYASYDWVIFCWLFGRMIDLPPRYPMYPADLKQMMDAKGLDSEWKRANCPDPKGGHNALVDAKWNLKLFNAIEKE